MYYGLDLVKKQGNTNQNASSGRISPQYENGWCFKLVSYDDIFHATSNSEID